MSVTPESSPRRWIRSVAGAVVALMASSIAAVALGVGVAGADTAPVDPTEPETVAADSLPTVQIDGVVWDQVVVGNTVYATGSFTSARPAGSAAGTNETPRSNILAYDITTGNLITSWAPTLNAQGRTLEASADGSTNCGGSGSGKNDGPGEGMRDRPKPSRLTNFCTSLLCNCRSDSALEGRGRGGGW